jgi:hypothetical protein
VKIARPSHAKDQRIVYGNQHLIHPLRTKRGLYDFSDDFRGDYIVPLRFLSRTALKLSRYYVCWFYIPGLPATWGMRLF